MKKQIIGIVIVMIYAVPFAYYAMHTDFTSGLVTGYGLMIASSLVRVSLHTLQLHPLLDRREYPNGGGIPLLEQPYSG